MALEKLLLRPNGGVLRRQLRGCRDRLAGLVVLAQATLDASQRDVIHDDLGIEFEELTEDAARFIETIVSSRG